MKAVIYVRVSSTEQSEGFSLEAQLDLLRSYAIKNQIEVIREYIETESAKSAGRPQFEAMLGFMAESSEVQTILVEKTDRLYRNFSDWVKLDPDSSGLSIHLVKENEILGKESKSHQKFIHGIKVLMAKNFIDNLSEETKKGMYKKLDKGGYPFMAPVGYRNDPVSHEVVLDPENALYVKKAFQEFSTGRYSLNALNDFLYQEGFRSPRAKKKPNKEAMKRVLTNKFYYGVMDVKGKEYPGSHEPLISKELYDEVQSLIGNIRKPRFNVKNLPFSALMTCGHCGRSITGEEKRKASGLKYVYYHCTGTRGECSHVTYLEQSKIENIFSLAISRLQIPDEIVEATKKALVESHKDQQVYYYKTIEKLNREHLRLQNYIDSSYEDKLTGKIDLDFWERKNSDWRKAQSDIRSSIAKHEKAQSSYHLEGINFLELAKNAHSLYERQPIEQKQLLIRKLFSNCRIENGSICFDWKKPFDVMIKYSEVKKWGPWASLSRTIFRRQIS